MAIQLKTVSGELVTSEHDAAAAAEGLYVGGDKVVGTQEATIADASVAHALNATFSDTEAEAALNALGVKINAILAALEAHGLVASA